MGNNVDGMLGDEITIAEVLQSDGYNTAKSPEGMFPDLKIPNDLNYVDGQIREFWGL